MNTITQAEIEKTKLLARELVDISIFYMGYTKIPELFSSRSCLPFMYDKKIVPWCVCQVHFYGDHTDNKKTLICSFERHDRAYIFDPRPGQEIADLQKRKVYGFRGSWDEVIEKIREADAIIVTAAPAYAA